VLPTTKRQAPVEPLTNREEEVLKLLVLALTNVQMAEQLHISVRTIETHLSNIYGKLEVRGRFEALLSILNAGELAEAWHRSGDGMPTPGDAPPDQANSNHLAAPLCLIPPQRRQAGHVGRHYALT
jgi:DNA-binding CsgD family transcriptional regulator